MSNWKCRYYETDATIFDASFCPTEKYKKKLSGEPESFKLERMKGVEPSSSAWKL